MATAPLAAVSPSSSPAAVLFAPSATAPVPLAVLGSPSATAPSPMARWSRPIATAPPFAVAALADVEPDPMATFCPIAPVPTPYPMAILFPLPLAVDASRPMAMSFKPRAMAPWPCAIE
ncbi:hypothetical protein EGT29_10850 [Pigmentiphaga sp. H8]|nr:hypothetical protein EGT29_10850 [Pigmentiphaga sp. H8]